MDTSLSAFEYSSMLQQLALHNQAHQQMLNAGRGNPNWIHTLGRQAYARLLAFGIQESERTAQGFSMAGYVQTEGIAARLHDFLSLAEEPDVFLQKALQYCSQTLGMPADALLAEWANGALGNDYPVPPRILPFTERILEAYLQHNLFKASLPIKLFATEGASAAICYVFKTLRINGLLRAKDHIALATPIFPPYLQIPMLQDYRFSEVDLRAKEEHGWQLDPQQLERLDDPSIRMLFLVNPSNPGSHSLGPQAMQALRQVVERRPDLLVLTDDVYGTFAPSYQSLYASIPHNTIFVYSFSKLYGTTGMRLGVVGLHPQNRFDEMLAAAKPAQRRKLSARYALVSTQPDMLPLIERMAADSRDVGLYHTAGLSTPQQIHMALFALSSLVDPDNRYLQECNALVRRRYQALLEALGLPPDMREDDSCYYALIDIYALAEQRYGREFRTFLEGKASSQDFLYRLSREEGSVLIDGTGFGAPAGNVRVSQANLPTEAYAQIGREILQMLQEYHAEFSKS